ncbi:hypothetical protein SNE25_03135 [Mucilaginibacter sabulilitoris]|uniref:Uncharacterized protein n=1 Tax=Mucilaginibacter sabulilitoris TaxID=1173583 RepID=A0ABZ0TMW7_9SPHI|nr:hypothetical protein [Mucilaginibacter sabulilitoris]WPU94514.1 hypothetical protein SNE25_03135 [Mucilaginibacter sabulilitoris]
MLSPYQNAVKYLNELFHLPASGQEQDWDIEMADPKRLKEFTDAFEINMPLAVKQALLSLILASYDDFLKSDKDLDNHQWNKIKSIIEAEPHHYEQLLIYWAMEGNDNAVDMFDITPRIRSYLNDI